MNILDRIIQARRERLKSEMNRRPLALFRDQIPVKASGRFLQAVSQKGVNIIAEVKRASPSKGVICRDFDPVAIARAYTKAGAAAISVLTEEDFFQGSLQVLVEVRAATQLPILRKDFIIDPYQVYEAADAGADAFLLIASVLEPAQISDLLVLGQELGLDALVEVHTAIELEKVLNCPVRLIGVNNRNLKDFTVDLTLSERLAKLCPADVVLVSESGIESGDDISRLRMCGYSAFLVGERLMRSPSEALSALIHQN